MMKNLISSHWSDNELPGINCFVNSEGEITLLNCFRNEEGRPYSFPFCNTTITSLLKYNEDIWTEVQIFERVAHPENNLIYVGGEGGMGNEGFIACTDNSNNLIWAAFFENSNPFSKLEIIGDTLHARSTSGYVYIVDINDPESLTIEK